MHVVLQLTSESLVEIPSCLLGPKVHLSSGKSAWSLTGHFEVCVLRSIRIVVFEGQVIDSLIR